MNKTSVYHVVSSLLKCLCLIALMWSFQTNDIYAANVEGLKPLNEQKWRELTSDKRYHEKQKEKRKFDETLQKPHEVVASKVEETNPYAQPFMSPYFLFIFFGGLLLLLLYLLFRKQLAIRNAKVTHTDFNFNLEHIEDNLEKLQLDDYILKAIANGDFKTAIRLHYLNILKQLSALGLIKWKKDKTNRNYLTEMSSQSQFKLFRYLTLYFEQAWYGDAEVDANVYQAYKLMYDDFLKHFNISNEK
ncbi:MAG: hypothetical protein HYZ42_00575 [Bacteroidetes bacterium]|nr:hypothetical protein [Bacteroidota bacterium]